MLVHARLSDLDYNRSRFNTTDTYIFIEGRFHRDEIDESLTTLSALGWKYRILFRDKAINNYINHRGERRDDEPQRFVQQVTIIEFDNVST